LYPISYHTVIHLQLICIDTAIAVHVSYSILLFDLVVKNLGSK